MVVVADVVVVAVVVDVPVIAVAVAVGTSAVVGARAAESEHVGWIFWAQDCGVFAIAMASVESSLSQQIRHSS